MIQFRERGIVAQGRLRLSKSSIRSAVYGGLFQLLRKRPFRERKVAGHRIFNLIKASEIDSQRLVSLYPKGPEVRTQNKREVESTDPPMYPELQARFLENALISSNPRLSATIRESQFIIPAVADDGPWKIDVGTPTRGGMKYIRDSSILVQVREHRTEIERGIFVGTWSPHNWFHWLIDTLPTIFLAQNLPKTYDSWPLLLPQSVSERNHWLEPLDLVSNGRTIDFSLLPNMYKRVSKLLWLDSPTSPGPISRTRPEKNSLRVHSNALNEYRNHMIQKLDLGNSSSPERVFLARSQQGNRPYNQDALIRIASAYGFESVFLEELSFSDSVRALLTAKFIVGPHGAGWANSLFNTCQASALMWTWSKGPNRNWFSNVAKVAGVDMKTIFTDSPKSLKLKGKTHQTSTHCLPEELFEMEIDEMLRK